MSRHLRLADGRGILVLRHATGQVRWVGTSRILRMSPGCPCDGVLSDLAPGAGTRRSGTGEDCIVGRGAYIGPAVVLTNDVYPVQCFPCNHLRMGPWEVLKASGIRALKGDAYSAASRLLTELDGLGIVLVEEGTLERLAPEVTVRKGPEWVAAAIEQGAPANGETQEHLGRLLSTGPVRSTAE